MGLNPLLLLICFITFLIQTSTSIPFDPTRPLALQNQDDKNDSKTTPDTALTASDCNDLTWNLRPECWDILDIPEWLTQWWDRNAAACEKHNATFSSCFQQMAGVKQQQCDTIGSGLCSFPTDITDFSPQEAYVLYAIFGIYQWFFSLWQGIANANLGAHGPVGQIVEAINPIKTSNKLWMDILQAFTALTPLFRAPALVGGLANTLETALRQSPGVLKQMLPSGSLNSQFEQINDIYDGLSKIQKFYQANLTNALTLVQSSLPTFLDFAAQGGFIAPQASLQAQSSVLVASLQTFIVSTCLNQNNIFITLTRDTNPHELVTNGSLGQSNLVSCDYYEDHNICSTWWYDAPNNRAFALSSVDDPQTNFYDLLTEMFRNEWTTPSLLFSGAIDCADYVKSTGKSNQPQLDLDTMRAHCMSNTQVCVYDQSCGIGDSDCEFTGEYGGTEDGPCKPAKGYMWSCGMSWGSQRRSARIPAAYLGPMNMVSEDDMEVCND
ncbi:MAG: hypothetical protein Q9208_004010 [Pyrenodesmia sp. 3 TL-2023]